MYENITEYADELLSDIVFTDSYLYNLRTDVKTLLTELRNKYQFNQDQLNILLADLLCVNLETQ